MGFLLVAVTTKFYDGDAKHCEQPALSCSYIEGLMGFSFAGDRFGSAAGCIMI